MSRDEEERKMASSPLGTGKSFNKNSKRNFLYEVNILLSAMSSNGTAPRFPLKLPRSTYREITVDTRKKQIQEGRFSVSRHH